MHDEHSNPQSTEHAEKLGYEDTDISIPVLMKWGFFLVVFVGVTSVIVLVLYAWLVPHFVDRIVKHGAETPIVRRTLASDVPQLQENPVKDIKEFRSREAAHVTGYGIWKDGDGKDAQYIPLDRAMKIVGDKGLPIQSAGSAANDVTPPAVDRGFVDNPLPDGTKPGVSGKVGPENGDNMDESSFTRHTPGM